MIDYCMMVFCMSCTVLFQVFRGAWSAIMRTCSHWDHVGHCWRTWVQLKLVFYLVPVLKPYITR